MVVDEVQATREMFRIILEHEGFEVWEAYTSEVALRQIHKRPNLVILDVRLPGELSGVEVCLWLKKDKKYRVGCTFVEIPEVLHFILGEHRHHD